MKVTKILKCVTFDSLEEVVTAIKNGEAENITMVDLSPIDSLSIPNTWGEEYLFCEKFFPNLKELLYINHRGEIRQNFFRDSALQKAEISCNILGKNSFENSKNLEDLNLINATTLYLSALNGTGIDEFTIPRYTKKLVVSANDFPENLKKVNLPVKQVFDFTEAENKLKVTGFKDGGSTDKLLAQIGFKNFLDFVALDPNIYINLLHCEKLSHNYLASMMKSSVTFFNNRIKDESLTDEEHLEDYNNFRAFKLKYNKDLLKVQGSIDPNEFFDSL